MDKRWNSLTNKQTDHLNTLERRTNHCHMIFTVPKTIFLDSIFTSNAAILDILRLIYSLSLSLHITISSLCNFASTISFNTLLENTSTFIYAHFPLSLSSISALSSLLVPLLSHIWRKRKKAVRAETCIFESQSRREEDIEVRIC